MIEMPPLPTGDLTVDSLQRMQLQAHEIADRDFKMQHIKNVVHQIGRVLFERQLIVSAHQFFIQEPDSAPDELTFIGNELYFSGKLDNFGYMYDPSLPLDSLVLAIVEPESLELDLDAASALRQSTVKVPILNIASCSVI